jgi:hypothetical protein
LRVLTFATLGLVEEMTVEHDPKTKKSDDPLRVFISYCRPNPTDDVRHVVQQLRERGCETWWDTENLKPGDSFRAAIEDELKKCKVALVFLSKDSLKSDWASAELSTIRECAWDRPDFEVVPVLMDDSKLPPALHDWAPNCVNTNDRNSGWTAVVKAVLAAPDTPAKPKEQTDDTPETTKRLRELRFLLERSKGHDVR